MSVAYNKSRRNITANPIYRLYNILLRGVMLRHISRTQHNQPQTAGKMARIYYCNIFKGFCRLTGIFITGTNMLSHCDVDNILSLSKLFSKKSFVILHLRRLRIPFMPLRNMYQQLIWLNLLIIQETTVIGANIIRTYRNIKLVADNFRQIAHAICRNQNRAPL